MNRGDLIHERAEQLMSANAQLTYEAAAIAADKELTRAERLAEAIRDGGQVGEIAMRELRASPFASVFGAVDPPAPKPAPAYAPPPPRPARSAERERPIIQRACAIAKAATFAGTFDDAMRRAESELLGKATPGTVKMIDGARSGR